MSAIILTGWDVLDEARGMLRAAAAGVGPDGWTRPTPCSDWSVAQVLQHAALDQRVWGATLAGVDLATVLAPGENPFAPSGQLGADPVACTDQALAESAPAWTRAGAGTVPTPLPQGEMPAADAAGAAALDAAIHAWDIALATGQDSPLSPALARALRPIAEGIVEPLRAYGAYAQALAAGPGADEAAALLCYLGRRPDWAAR